MSSGRTATEGPACLRGAPLARLHTPVREWWSRRGRSTRVVVQGSGKLSRVPSGMGSGQDQPEERSHAAGCVLAAESAWSMQWSLGPSGHRWAIIEAEAPRKSPKAPTAPVVLGPIGARLGPWVLSPLVMHWSPGGPRTPTTRSPKTATCGRCWRGTCRRIGSATSRFGLRHSPVTSPPWSDRQRRGTSSGPTCRSWSGGTRWAAAPSPSSSTPTITVPDNGCGRAAWWRCRAVLARPTSRPCSSICCPWRARPGTHARPRARSDSPVPCAGPPTRWSATGSCRRWSTPTTGPRSGARSS